MSDDAAMTEDVGQADQLGWMQAMHSEARQQTALLAQIKQHTALLYWVGIVSLVVLGLGGLAWLASVLGQ